MYFFRRFVASVSDLSMDTSVSDLHESQMDSAFYLFWDLDLSSDSLFSFRIGCTTTAFRTTTATRTGIPESSSCSSVSSATVISSPPFLSGQKNITITSQVPVFDIVSVPVRCLEHGLMIFLYPVPQRLA
jgi:hypothetical protein